MEEDLNRQDAKAAKGRWALVGLNRLINDDC
jgi:hypothetical protein